MPSISFMQPAYPDCDGCIRFFFGIHDVLLILHAPYTTILLMCNEKPDGQRQRIGVMKGNPPSAGQLAADIRLSWEEWLGLRPAQHFCLSNRETEMCLV